MILEMRFLHSFPILCLFTERNKLTGTIPREIGNLVKLEKLDLRKYFLGDCKSASSCTCSDSHRILYLRVGNNRLQGAVPAEVENLAVSYDTEVLLSKLNKGCFFFIHHSEII